jgi:hypothetical protein
MPCRDDETFSWEFSRFAGKIGAFVQISEQKCRAPQA